MLADLTIEEKNKFKELVELYTDAKGLILYAEEVDPDARSNLQIIKELRDALDHIMRAFSGKLIKNAEADGENYCNENFKKAVGHLYRAAFDALDGTVLSIKLKINESLKGYPVEVISKVITEYYEIKIELNALTENIAKHRSRKDVKKDIGVILDNYVEDVKSLKEVYKKILAAIPVLNEAFDQHKFNSRKNTLKTYFKIVAAAVIGALITIFFKMLFLS